MYLNFTDEQRALLLAIHQQKAEERLSANFADPALDGKTIRALIHMQGGADMLQYLLEFDGLLREQKEQEKQNLLSSNDDQNII